jgi:hypothetical protein
MKDRRPFCLASFLLSAFLSSFCACSSLPLAGLSFTSIDGAKVIESKGKIDGEPVTLYTFFFDTFQGSFSEEVQVTMLMLDQAGARMYKLGMSGSNTRAVKAAPLCVAADGKEFVLPIDTLMIEEHNRKHMGPGYWGRESHKEATYVVTEELRSSLLAAGRIEIGIKKKMRAINERDLRDVKALLAAEAFVPDDPGK